MGEKKVFLNKRMSMVWRCRLEKIKKGLSSKKTRKVLRVVGSLILGVGTFCLLRKTAFALDLNADLPQKTIKRTWKEFFDNCKKRFMPSTYKGKLVFLASTIGLGTLLGLHLYLSAIELANEEEMIALVQAAMARYYETEKK